jgi:TolB protein
MLKDYIKKHIKKIIFVKVLVIAVIIFITAKAYAVLDLELTQGVTSTMPIAILPFAGQEVITSPDNNIHDVVSNDLKNSGKFGLADVSGAGNSIDYSFWQQKKVNDVVTGQITQLNGNQYQVSFALNDVYTKNTLLAKQYTVKNSELRALAHHISDLIYEQLTGDKGIFSTKIAYIVVQRQSARNAKYNLEVSDVDGYNPKILLVSSFPIMSPSWSKDGKQVAYVSFEGNRAAIYAEDVATGARRLISKFPGINGAPAWSSDGSKMALVLSVTGYPKIYVLDIASGKTEQLTSDWYLDTEPSWSQDGRSIIFTSNRGGSPQIYRVNLADKKVTRVTFSGSYNARASFTPDGKTMVMLHQDGGNFNIAAQSLESGRVTVLTRSGNDESPSIAPNGKMVVYATNNGGKGVLGEVSIDGRVKLLLPAREGEVQEPAWSPFLN